MNTNEAEELFSRARDGDPLAIKQLLCTHRARLRSMIVAYLDPRVRPRVDPSDVVQETLVDAAVRLPDYLETQPLDFYPWLRRLAKDRMHSIHREHIHTQKRSVKREQQLRARVSDESVQSLADQLVDPASSPISAAIKRERKEILLQELRQLSDSEQELLLMRFTEQMSVPEISRSLGVSEPAVKSRLLRALERLNRRFENRVE